MVARNQPRSGPESTGRGKKMRVRTTEDSLASSLWNFEDATSIDHRLPMIWRTGDPWGSRDRPRADLWSHGTFAAAAQALLSPLGWTASLRRETRRGWDGNALSGIAEREYPVAVGGRADQLSSLGPDPQVGHGLGSLCRDVSGRSWALDTRFLHHPFRFWLSGLGGARCRFRRGHRAEIAALGRGRLGGCSRLRRGCAFRTERRDNGRRSGHSWLAWSLGWRRRLTENRIFLRGGGHRFSRDFNNGTSRARFDHTRF